MSLSLSLCLPSTVCPQLSKKVQGWLVPNPLETPFINNVLKGIDCPQDKALQAVLANQDDGGTDRAVELVEGSEKLSKTARLFYQGWLGYYCSNVGKLSGDPKTGGKCTKQLLVHVANDLARQIGLSEPPALLKKTARMMGLASLNGVRVEAQPAASTGRGNGGRNGNSGGAKKKVKARQFPHRN